MLICVGSKDNSVEMYKFVITLQIIFTLTEFRLFNRNLYIVFMMWFLIRT